MFPHSPLKQHKHPGSRAGVGLTLNHNTPLIYVIAPRGGGQQSMAGRSKMHRGWMGFSGSNKPWLFVPKLEAAIASPLTLRPNRSGRVVGEPVVRYWEHDCGFIIPLFPPAGIVSSSYTTLS